jgi:uncharacterized membrane protein YgcG
VADAGTVRMRPIPEVSVRRILAVVALAAALVLPPCPALADPPFGVHAPVTDRAGVLNPDGFRRVTDAIAQLGSEDQLQLFVVYVDSFDGTGAPDWAGDTASQSGRRGTYFLFAVAVDDGLYGYSVNQSFPLSDAELDNLFTQDVVPELSAGNFEGAALALADGLGSIGGASASANTASPSTNTGSEAISDPGEPDGIASVGIAGGIAAVAGGLAAGIGGVYLLSRVRRPRSVASTNGQPEQHAGEGST